MVFGVFFVCFRSLSSLCVTFAKCTILFLFPRPSAFFSSFSIEPVPLSQFSPCGRVCQKSCFESPHQATREREKSPRETSE
ncbi:hypothetical protein DFJ73DRAFT_842707 [Zopfochytrium polystomum]|nr:hypothetical protein DFJ73DRAFT_842707 [Zopfochytrium polystomum]